MAAREAALRCGSERRSSMAYPGAKRTMDAARNPHTKRVMTSERMLWKNRLSIETLRARGDRRLRLHDHAVAGFGGSILAIEHCIVLAFVGVHAAVGFGQKLFSIVGALGIADLAHAE